MDHCTDIHANNVSTLGSVEAQMETDDSVIIKLGISFPQFR